MTLYEWVKDLFKNGVELFNDSIQIDSKGVVLNRDTKKLKECSIGIISSKDSKEWYNVCRLNCPVGTVIEDYDSKWEELYNDVYTLVKLKLTQALIKERANKSARTFLDILERRSRDEWHKDTAQKEVKVESKSQDINIVIRDWNE